MFKSANYQDISLAEWMAHTPHLLMDQHLQGKRPAMAVLTRGEGLEVKPSSAAQQVARATRSTAATR